MCPDSNLWCVYNWPDSVDMILSYVTIVTLKPIINTYFSPFSWKHLFFVNHKLINILKDFKNAPLALMLVYVENWIFSFCEK